MGKAEDAMKPDPADSLTIATVIRPASRGPGSGKNAWVRFAETMAESSDILHQTCEEQSRLITALRAEVDRLQRHIATRKPKGGRPHISEDLAVLIRADLARGYSQRAAAVRNGVSAMTVSRLPRD